MNLFGFCVFLIRAYPNLPTSRKRLPGWFFFSVSLPTPFDQGPAHLLTVLFPRPPLSSPPRSLLHHPTLETSTISLLFRTALVTVARRVLKVQIFILTAGVEGGGEERFPKIRRRGQTSPKNSPPSCSAQNYAHLRGPRKPKKPRKRSKKLITVGALETLNFCRTWANTLSDKARDQQPLPETKTATRHCRKKAVTRRRKRRG